MIRIYKLANHVDWWAWLCPACKERWEAGGWQVREAKDPPIAGDAGPVVLTCDDRDKHDEAAAAA